LLVQLVERWMAVYFKGMCQSFNSSALCCLTLAALASVCVATAGCGSARAIPDEVILVGTVAELEAALRPQNTGRHIRVRAGDYPVNAPLIVPDGTRLEGEGVMRVEGGSPAGIEPGTVTTIRAAANFEGDLLTLGNEVVLAGLRLEDFNTGFEEISIRKGNVVVVTSRAANDSVSAQIRNSEIICPNNSGVMMNGPSGHCLLVFTRNLKRQDAPPPHAGAQIAVRLERSIVRAAGGAGALFEMNFAAHGRVAVTFDGNHIEGPLAIAGGASRPDLVTGAESSFESRNSRYVCPGTCVHPAWRLFGGTSAHLPGLAVPGANHNLVRVHSVNDRIDGFQTGISAAAARRWLTASGPVSDNRIELELKGTRIRTTGEGAADLELLGALSAAEDDGNQEFLPGDRNILHVLIRNSVGSFSPRTNGYTAVLGPKLVSNLGTGNRVEFEGSLEEFTQSNPGLSPAPPAEYFLDKP
jgi:hypothetical protein